jgi:hypothetical protein
MPPPAAAPPTTAAAAEGTLICTHCGAPIPPGFKFCGQCGKPFEDAPAPDEPAAAAPEPEPVAPPAGKMVFIRPDGAEGDSHELRVGGNQVGRNHGALFENDGYLSPDHGEITVKDGKIFLKDTSSLNGVFFKITKEEELQPGDVIRIGQELLRFDAVLPPAPLEDGTDIMGSPNPGCWGRLTVVVGYGVDGNAYPLKGDSIVIGRERGDILFPDDGYVSGTHLQLVQRGDKYYIEDLGSSNGTFLKIRDEREVLPASFVLMGQQLFRLELL